MEFPLYYAELHSQDDGTPNLHFASDEKAIKHYVSHHGKDLMAVIKDDNESINVIHATAPVGMFLPR